MHKDSKISVLKKKTRKTLYGNIYLNSQQERTKNIDN